VKKKRLHSCNVLDPGPAERHLWNFQIDRDEAKLQREEALPPNAVLPEKLVVKDWHDLYQPKLNIAWLPSEQVFLRVVQLPAVDRQELLSMLEFQLEKISPLPVAQIVWSAEVLPSTAEQSQTAIVCVVSRDVVETFLGDVGERQYQPDRLEVPQLNQIIAGGVRENGAWIYAGSGTDANLCTVVWWAGGTLQQVQVVRLPDLSADGTPADALVQSRFLQEQLMQIAWAGEVEGWFNVPLRWHLVADEATAAAWRPLITSWAEGDVDLHPALDRNGLAHLSAQRAARGEPGANLLPVEFATRFHQQYIDRLWMRGLGAVVIVYLAVVMIYMIGLQVLSFQQGRLQAQVASIANSYTNVLQLKERVQVLQEQLNLKYAALDCSKLASELLPADFSLVSLSFGRGRTLELQGTAPPGQEKKVIEYNDDLRKATVNGERLFREVTPPTTFSRGTPNLHWNFRCELNVRDAAE
jgi:hypothetical protein